MEFFHVIIIWFLGFSALSCCLFKKELQKGLVGCNKVVCLQPQKPATVYVLFLREKFIVTWF
tara:strand:- start:83 stop:268 length:186 start_codon:yes stop_codon:yes gene_type:complete